MIKEIKYNGFTATPSDYECPDGELSAAINILPEEGEINPILPSSLLFTLPDGYKVVFIHTNSGYKHYIVRNGKKLYWIDLPEKGTELTEEAFSDQNLLKDYTDDSIYDINAVGNTLIVLSGEGLNYFLWKNTFYKFIGSHLPELPISFGLKGYRVVEDMGNIEYADINEEAVQNTILGRVNASVAVYTKVTFMYPFFVRYAYRLYDGSLTMHSAPVLMNCPHIQNPYLATTEITSAVDGEGVHKETANDCKIILFYFTLDFAIVQENLNNYLEELKEWSDIVSSIDLFISEPIYTYDQSGKVSGHSAFNQATLKGDYCVAKMNGNWMFSSPYYQTHDMFTLLIGAYGKQHGSSQLITPRRLFDLPLRTDCVKKASSVSNFYFLKSYPLKTLSYGRWEVGIGDVDLHSLTAHEVMTDDYDSHSTIIAKKAFSYNSRLNLTSISKAYPRAFHIASLLNHTDGFLQPQNNNIDDIDHEYESYQLNLATFYYLSNDYVNGRQIVARALDVAYSSIVGGYYSRANFGMFTPIDFLYYPSTNAIKVGLNIRVPQKGTDAIFREVSLIQHDTLNGSYFFSGWSGDQYPGVEVSGIDPGGGETAAYRTVSVPNKIYTSEVNNPFAFPVLGISTVGTGTILAICSAVKALSQGQFGQFPLYAFTDEGVWALEVSSAGTFSARQPVTRDVCTNPDSITQIDSAVLFTTDRGIMIISGSNSQCISDSINSVDVFDIDVLPGITSLVDDCIATVNDFVPFKTFLLNAKMLYDYTNQRIIVYNPNRRYAYVYSLKSKQWGLMQSSIKDSINSYPDALAMVTVSDGSPSERNAVFNFSQTVTGDAPVNGLLITRPLKLGAPDLLKTIDTVIQRGYFRKGHVKTILYGSRDLFNWELIYSSTDHYLRGFRGTPYKYFRIALLCSLTKDESIFGCTVQYTPRLLDQPR